MTQAHLNKLIVDHLKDSASSISREAATKRKQIYRTSLKVLGHPVPLQRKIYKTLSQNLGPDEKQTLRLWHHVWTHSEIFEAKALALLYYESIHLKDEPLRAWPTVRSWAKHLENWAHSDTLSKCYAALLERFPSRIYPTLHTWNSSINPWLRRQSIVSLLCYSSLRTHVLPKTKLFPLVQSLLHDQHYYVQKGVGWTLRELSNVYPQYTWSFLKTHALEISPHAFSASIEKLSPSQKDTLKRMREKHRRTRQA